MKSFGSDHTAKIVEFIYLTAWQITKSHVHYSKSKMQVTWAVPNQLLIISLCSKPRAGEIQKVR